MSEWPQVILVSGGRTSGFLLRKMIENVPDYRERFRFCFANTGKEKPQTLDFVHRMETEWNVPIVWVEYHREDARKIPAGIFPTELRNKNLARAAERGETSHWFKIVDYDKASRKGEPFDELLNWMIALPNVVSRACSTQLKIRTIMRFLFAQGLHHYSPIIGIRKDEERRKTQILASCDNFEHPLFPLIDWNIRVENIMEFWSQNNFDLQLKNYEGNCDLCFLKAKWKRILLIKENPASVNWWKDWERKANERASGRGNMFRLGEPYEALEQLAINPHPELELAATDDIPCTCLEKAFDKSED